MGILIFIKIVSFVLIILPVLINVAFITLLERKVLRLSQFRLGPNKVRIIGILQPIADAVKLFRNQIIVTFSRNLSLFFISPILISCWCDIMSALFRQILILSSCSLID